MDGWKVGLVCFVRTDTGAVDRGQQAGARDALGYERNLEEHGLGDARALEGHVLVEGRQILGRVLCVDAPRAVEQERMGHDACRRFGLGKGGGGQALSTGLS